MQVLKKIVISVCKYDRCWRLTWFWNLGGEISKVENLRWNGWTAASWGEIYFWASSCCKKFSFGCFLLRVVNWDPGELVLRIEIYRFSWEITRLSYIITYVNWNSWNIVKGQIWIVLGVFGSNLMNNSTIIHMVLGDIKGWNIRLSKLKLWDLLQGLVSGSTLFDLEFVIPGVAGFSVCTGPLWLVLCLLRILSYKDAIFGYCVLTYLDESRANDMVLGDLKGWNITQVNRNSDDGCGVWFQGRLPFPSTKFNRPWCWEFRACNSWGNLTFRQSEPVFELSVDNILRQEFNFWVLYFDLPSCIQNKSHSVVEISKAET